MTSPVRILDAGGMHAVGRKAELSLIENNQELESVHRYDDYDFEFKDSRFISDTIEVTPSMRVRGVLSSLEQYDADLQLPATLKPLDRINKLLSQQVTINGDTRRRSEWIPPEEVAGKILRELDEQNHPIAQALAQLRSRYSDEQLSDFDYRQTVVDTLIATHENRFRTEYSERISALR